MITIKHLQMNQILALNNPEGVDIAVNQIKQAKPKYSYDYNQTFTNESNFGIK